MISLDKMLLWVAAGLVFLHGHPVMAGGVAEYIVIDTPEEIADGLIVEFLNGAYVLSTTPYSQSLIGVTDRNPRAAVSSIGKGSGSVPLITAGTVSVQVRGLVEVGDFITSSDTPGIGQAITQPGFTIGRALEGFAPDDADTLGSIKLSVNPTFAWPDDVKFNLRATFQDPQAVLVSLPRPLRYIVSVIVALLSLLSGWVLYTRITLVTVSALGRNPLAKNHIYALAGVQTAVTLGLVFGGFFLAYIILVL